VYSMQSPGLEADDIIATLAERALAEGCHVTIASPDKVVLVFCSLAPDTS
jgi:5'-3' exonuclease